MSRDSAVRPIRFLRVLGPTAAVTISGEEISFSGAQRRILARLAVTAPNRVHFSDVAHAVWGDHAPRTAKQALQNQISRIRGVLGDDAIVTIEDSYYLELTTDAELVRLASIEVEELLASGEAARAFDIADVALGLWMGEPFTDVHRTPQAGLMVDALSATVNALRNGRLEAAIATDRRNWALHEANVLAGAAPYDERRTALLAQALVLHGRRAEALAMIARTRRRLRRELGIEEGAELAAVETQILLPHWNKLGSQPRSQEVFVGRKSELRAILGEVARVRPVLVHGEPGIGVSRLLIEARGRLLHFGLQVVLLRAEEYPDSAVSLISEILTELRVEITPGHGVLTTFDELLDSLPEDAPLVVIIDDAQFLGPSVARVIQRAATHPNVRVILGAYGTDLRFKDFAYVNLAGLDPVSVAAIARSRGVAKPSDALFQHCGGNPTVLTALLDSIERGSPIPEVPAPSQELAALANRLINPLNSRDRHDVLLAAVAGTGYPRRAFDHINWPWPPNFPPELIQWTPEATLTFRHEAVRTTLYNSLPRGQVLEFHHVLGLAAATAGAPTATVAGHLLAAAEIDPSAAIDAARAAAASASQHGAYFDAARWLEKAQDVDPGTDPTRSLALRIGHADALRLAGDPAHLPTALAAVEEALTCDDEDLITQSAFVLLQLGGSSPAGQLDPRIRSLTYRALTAITDPDRRALVQGAASLAWSLTGNAAECRQLFHDAEAGAVGEDTRRGVLPFAYLALGMPADLPQRRELATELLELAEKAGDPQARFEGLQLNFTVFLQEGDGAGARHALRGMRELVDQVGDVGRRWSLLYCSASIAELDGNDAESERLAEQAQATFAPVSQARAAAAFYAQLLSLRTRQGRLAELASVISELVASQPGIPAWHAAQALTLAKTDDTAATRIEALHHARLALDLAQEDFTWLASHLVGGRAAAVLGDVGVIKQYRRRLEPWAHLVCWQGTCSYGPVATVLALLSRALGEHEAAETYARRARELARSLGAPAYETDLAALGLP